MNKTPVRERILQTAEKLFYEQGYRATGINQIIKEAEVAKASFYQYFPSKEELCVAYLQERSLKSNAKQKQYLTTGDTPADRICNLFENIRNNALENDFNGCPFLNISSEINEHESDIRKAVTTHKSNLMTFIRHELRSYKDCDALTEMIYLIYEGANIAVKNYRELWPVDRGIETARQLLTRGDK